MSIFATKWLAARWHRAGYTTINPKAMTNADLVRSEDGTPTVFDLRIGGWSWSLVLEPERMELSQAIQEFILQTGKPWLVAVDLSEHRYYSWKTDYKLAGTAEVVSPEWAEQCPWDAVDMDAPCPCGLGLVPFADCCHTTWVHTTVSVC
ncbi:MAG TPA: hypothetical protein DGG94_14515 [Micromonosporaceae bacterium]|nr:hypothetical protein [Micromonosporaceae bacterium]HCU50986.1 hypothetical protein [Micromonosporaceae bacterium]